MINQLDNTPYPQLAFIFDNILCTSVLQKFKFITRAVLEPNITVQPNSIASINGSQSTSSRSTQILTNKIIPTFPPSFLPSVLPS